MNAISVRDRGKLPQVGQFAWDLTGPCYLAGMVSYMKKQIVPAFLAADIVLDHSVSLAGLRPFFSKWGSLQAQKRKARFQPMMVADSL